VAYADFSIEELKTRFKVRLDESQEFFASISPVDLTSLLRVTLAENIPLAVAVSTEKAQSELIISPIFLELRRRFQHQISLFSGMDFNVDANEGLKGTPDFLVSLSTEQLTIEVPVVVVVEAKNDNLKAGLAQCIAEMIAARLFNRQRGKEIATIYGVVTTGSLWKFLMLAGDVVSVDLREYHIHEVGRVVGILVHMVQSARTADGSVAINKAP